MSATITSSLGTTITTTHAWLGETGASASVQRVDGYEKRRNQATSPLNGTTLNGLSSLRATLSLGADFVRATVTDAAAGGLSQRVQLGGTGYVMPATPGVAMPLSIELRTSASRPMAIRALWLNDSGALVTSTEIATAIATTSAAWARFEGTATPPLSATRLLLYIGLGTAGTAVGETFDSRRLFIGDLGPYFDGSTPSSSETKGDTTNPTLVLGFETARASQSIFHDVIGGGQDVTLRPAALRSGTLRLFYLTEAAAASALEMHSKAALFYVVDPDRPVVTMYYAVDGDVRLALDDTRQFWSVDVAYQEVSP